MPRKHKFDVSTKFCFPDNAIVCFLFSGRKADLKKLEKLGKSQGIWLQVWENILKPFTHILGCDMVRYFSDFSIMVV